MDDISTLQVTCSRTEKVPNTTQKSVAHRLRGTRTFSTHGSRDSRPSGSSRNEKQKLPTAFLNEVRIVYKDNDEKAVRGNRATYKFSCT